MVNFIEKEKEKKMKRMGAITVPILLLYDKKYSV